MTPNRSVPSIKTASALLTRLRAELDRMPAPSRRSTLIAIDGASGAGKSTIAADLAKSLPAGLLHGDDFFAGGVELQPLDAKTLADTCIDRDRLGAALNQLKTTGATEFAPFDWQSFDGSLAAPRIVSAIDGLCIVEGVYTAHPDLRPLIDIAVLVSTPAQECERRLILREGELGPWERQWRRAEDWYFQTLAPPDSFDMIFDNRETADD